MLKGNGDPDRNTTPPTGALEGSGWQYQGFWGGVLATPIAPQYFVAAKHVGGSVGGTFVFDGVPYRTVAYWDDPNSDLRIWQVDGGFSRWAPLYSGSDEIGKLLVVLGRGTQRGEEVWAPTVQTVYTTNSFNLRTSGLSRKQVLALYPNAVISKNGNVTYVTTTQVTNVVLKGWKAGISDGRIRWGKNIVSGDGNLLSATFDLNSDDDEAYLSSGDSSGAVFIQEGGVWKLAGINYAVQGPFARSPEEPAFYGAIFNQSGLYTDGYRVPDDGYVRPASFYATRISARLAWIQTIIAPLP